MSPQSRVDPQVFRKARRELGLTQSELAAELSATQSAVSMFEAGHPAALSAEKISAAAKVLGIDLKATDPVGAASPREWAYCPDFLCPSTVPFTIGDAVRFAITPVKAPIAEKTRCRLCGEVLEHGCPNPDCGAPVSGGAHCERCGTAYVGVELTPDIGAAAYVSSRQVEILEFRALTTSTLNDCTTRASRAASHAAEAGGDNA